MKHVLEQVITVERTSLGLIPDLSTLCVTLDKLFNSQEVSFFT